MQKRINFLLFTLRLMPTLLISGDTYPHRRTLRDLHARQSVERSEFLADPANLKSALVYELSNHEYCITYDHSSALSALGLRSSELSSDQWDILKDAKTKYLEGCE